MESLGSAPIGLAVCDLHESDALGASALSYCDVEKAMRALNIVGMVALIALSFFVGWAAMGGTEDNQPSPGVPVAATPARP